MGHGLPVHGGVDGENHLLDLPPGNPADEACKIEVLWASAIERRFYLASACQGLCLRKIQYIKTID